MGFEVLAALLMTQVFCIIVTYELVNNFLHFGEVTCLHIQDHEELRFSETSFTLYQSLWCNHAQKTSNNAKLELQ